MRAFQSLLIANRGEIALRIQRTARRVGLRTIAIHSDADAGARHAREADVSVRVGGPLPRDSYLDIGAIVAAAGRAGADAVHPGYGFLAEHAGFAEAVMAAGLVWVGPPPAAIRAMGDKAEAKRLAARAGVPVLPGCDDTTLSDAALAQAAAGIGFPLMIKAAAGGGGRGLRRVDRATAFPAALAQARSEATHAFGDGRVLLERALEGARHVEVQVFADRHGACVHLGERDCSVQRRHQKLIEESPSPAVDEALRARMGAAAVSAAREAGYVGAGTVEFLLDAQGQFWFMEMNTRLQGEHPVTEAVTGLDLVEWQLRVAMGEPLPARQEDIRFQGHAIEARLCAEDPARDCLPQSGTLLAWTAPPEVRVDHALEAGAAVLPYYDSMIAKLVAHAPTRDAARARLAQALESTLALGIVTNQSLLAAVLRDDAFGRCGPTTAFLTERFSGWQPAPTAAEDFAIAALLFADERARRAGYGEWAFWSNQPARVHRARLAGAAEPVDIALEGGRGDCRARVGGETVRLGMRAADGTLARVAVDGALEETVRYGIAGDTLHLARGAKRLAFRDVLHAPAERRDAGAGDGRLHAPMNGRVAAVHARAGDSVVAGAVLVVLEAMKMEHALTAPAAATVKAVLVAAGAQVSPGELLVELALAGRPEGNRPPSAS